MPPNTLESRPQGAPRRFTFRARHRLTHAREFQAVYASKLKKPVGPLVVFALRNGLPEHRLGLSVGRRVGNAVARGRVKRGIREAFRLTHHSLPTAPDGDHYDLIIVARPHQAARTPAYIDWLATGVRQIVAIEQRRGARQEPPRDDGARDGG